MIKKLPCNVKYEDTGPLGRICPYLFTTKRYDGFYGHLHFYIREFDYVLATENYERTYRCFAYCKERKRWVRVKIFKLWVTFYEFVTDPEDLKTIEEDFYG